MSGARPHLAMYLAHADPLIEVTMLDIPNLEWAAVGKYVRSDTYWYEFIGKHDDDVGTI